MSTLHVRTIVSPQPHPLKAELQKAGITISAAAQHAGYSYTHALNMLNGATQMSDAFSEGVAELIIRVKSGQLG